VGSWIVKGYIYYELVVCEIDGSALSVFVDVDPKKRGSGYAIGSGVQYVFDDLCLDGGVMTLRQHQGCQDPPQEYLQSP
jgi:hypothetical protein